MEPNKIDTKIREKVGSREIKPSDNGWDRLNAMLSVTEKKKKKNYSWLYVAATAAVFFTIGFWFFNQNGKEVIINNNNVVSKDNTIDTLKTKNYRINKEIFVNEKEANLVENNKELEEKNDEITSTILKTHETIKIKKKEEQKSNFLVENKKEGIKIDENTITKETNKYITAEILLASVENRNIEKKPLNRVDKGQKSILKVNTSSLLTSVETELDVEYRENKLEKISRNINQVKSTLANRNYE